MKSVADHRYFPTLDQLTGSDCPILEDVGYVSIEARALDLAWNAFQSGVVMPISTNGHNIWQTSQLPLQDEYRFLRKNFSPQWSYYVITLRLITLHNPFREFRAFWVNGRIKRLDHKLNVVHDRGYEHFHCKLLESKPLVSVVIPTLNRYRYLRDVLSDLELQTYRNFEVIVVDQSEPFDESTYAGWSFKIRVLKQKEKALWMARNDAIKSSLGEWILLFDDDSRVKPNWIEEHLKAVDYYKVDISSGISLSVVGDKIPSNYSYFRWADQLDTGNVLINRRVFHTTGLFDLMFEKQRMGDGEFGLRAYLAGFRNISNPNAARVHLKVGEGGLRQMGNWDAWRPKSFFAPVPIPSVLYFARRYFGFRRTWLLIIQNIVPAVIPYSFKSNRVLRAVSPIIFLVLMPLMVIRLTRSWVSSGRMLQEGPKIGRLE